MFRSQQLGIPGVAVSFFGTEEKLITQEKPTTLATSLQEYPLNWQRWVAVLPSPSNFTQSRGYVPTWRQEKTGKHKLLAMFQTCLLRTERCLQWLVDPMPDVIVKDLGLAQCCFQLPIIRILYLALGALFFHFSSLFRCFWRMRRNKSWSSVAVAAFLPSTSVLQSSQVLASAFLAWKASSFWFLRLISSLLWQRIGCCCGCGCGCGGSCSCSCSSCCCCCCCCCGCGCGCCCSSSSWCCCCCFCCCCCCCCCRCRGRCRRRSWSMMVWGSYNQTRSGQFLFVWESDTLAYSRTG